MAPLFICGFFKRRIFKHAVALTFLSGFVVPATAWSADCGQAAVAVLQQMATESVNYGNVGCADVVGTAFQRLGASGTSMSADALTAQLCGSDLSNYVKVTSDNISTIPAGAIVSGWTYGSFATTTVASESSSTTAFLNITHIMVSGGGDLILGNSSGLAADGAASSVTATGSVAATYSKALASGDLYYCLPTTSALSALGVKDCTATTGGTTTVETTTVDFSDCFDDSKASTQKEWMDGLTKAMKDSAERNSLKTHETIDAAATGDIKKRYCVGDKLQWMQWSSVQTMLLGMIQAVISSTIQQILDYVCAEEQAIVNNMLVKFCVPMPTFGNINLGLKADGMEACNGTKLLTLTTSTGVSVSPLPFPTAVTTFFTNLNSSGAK